MAPSSIQEAEHISSFYSLPPYFQVSTPVPSWTASSHVSSPPPRSLTFPTVGRHSSQAPPVPQRKEKRGVLWDRLFRLFSNALLYQTCAPFSLFTIFPQTISLLCTWVCLFVCFFSSHMCYYLCPINNSSFTTYFLHQIILFSPGLCN